MSQAAALYLKVGGALAILLIIAAVLYGAYRHGESVADARWQLKFADQQNLQAKGLAAATTANRAEEQRRQAAVNQVGNDARQQQAAAIVDASGADAAGERVRDQAGKLAAGASCATVNSGTARRSASATRAAMVLSDLFQRADKRAGELARAYDAARIAGLACEKAYQALSNPAR
ncbi:Protein of unknown function [Pseudomonas sp. NFACC02]|uniref:DUF2514 domain-containing protein n=1 Tax=Pseudomonas sp. NFACC02 TaxID=1566250 RepID=UPI0008ACFB94|nr:DUF2514 domain-containing protein [Pseudomonas sp. NFACC02]SEQ29554.1 Protein of unknown function [Pseudomonas sp. NFACC02]